MGRAEEYLNQIPMWTRKKNSLEDVRDVLDVMGAPDRDIPAIHVAGTNGKGSVCAFLTSILKEAGYKTGTFISPHLIEVRERFLINGAMVDEAVFEDGFGIVLEASRKMMEKGYCHPTFFEFLFLMAMVIFKKQDVDVMVLETGMGGRLDTTNVLEHPCACVITSISLDHTKYLGDTLEELAGEKAGIIKPGVPLIFDNNEPQVSNILEGCAFRRGAARYPVGMDDFRVVHIGGDGLEISARMRDEARMKLQIPFEALYQAENAMLAVRTLDVLRSGGKCSRKGSRVPGHGPVGAARCITWNIGDRQIAMGILKTVWPGRMEQVVPGIYLDGAHNPGGIRAFLQTAKEVSKRLDKQPYLLFAAVSDKDYRDMEAQLSAGIPWKCIGVVHINSDRGISSEILAKEFEETAGCPVVPFEDTRTAVRDMRKRSRDGVLFCVGSLYLIGEIKAVLNEIGVEHT